MNKFTHWHNPLNERYQIKEILGQGGLSSVYKTIDLYDSYFKNEKIFAVKLPSLNILKIEDIGAFLYAEYNILRDLNHPNIIKAYDFGFDTKNNIPYIILEYLNGKMLSNCFIYEFKAKTKDYIVQQLLIAMNYLHKKRVIHADINPTNIMLLEDMTIKIFDFGVSQYINKKLNFQFSFKKSRAYNPIYSAPEVLQGRLPSFKSDIFSLAVIIYELYEEKLPYEKNSLQLIENGIKKITFKKVPIKIRLWLKQALKLDPSRRINTFLSIKKKNYNFKYFYNIIKTFKKNND